MAGPLRLLHDIRRPLPQLAPLHPNPIDHLTDCGVNWLLPCSKSKDKRGVVGGTDEEQRECIPVNDGFIGTGPAAWRGAASIAKNGDIQL